MDVSGKARRRRENFQDLHFKIVDFTKEIVQIRPQNPKIFLACGGLSLKRPFLMTKVENPISKYLKIDL